MRIGVITFCFSKDNYGQILQCYALQRFLSKNGHKPFLINYRPHLIDEKPKFKIKNLFKYISKFRAYLKWWRNRTKELADKKEYKQKTENVNRGFDEFLSKNIEITALFNFSTIQNTPPIADVYICGSDQIWGTGGDWPFYLSFAPEGKKKIAYAPSMGGIINIPESVKPELLKLLSKFSFIGMREKSGRDTLLNLGVENITTVIDPTMLLTAQDYSVIADSPKKDKDYIFVYLLGKPSECKISEIFDFAQKRGLEVIYVVSGGRVDDYPKTYATIEEWLGYISRAEFVVTNSFHCTVFASIFNIPFATVLLNNGYERMNCRVEELLSNSKLSDRIYQGDFNRIFDSRIDFSGFNSYREAFANRSSEMLLYSINH